jgi:metal transporter CNNM
MTPSLRIAKVLMALVAFIPTLSAAPVINQLDSLHPGDKFNTMGDIYDEDPTQWWVNISVSIVLVLLGGVFAGLTLGLMGQDEIYLQVMKQSGTDSERKSAGKVLSLLGRGKHWLLVTLLLSNVITNETLPIVLDRCLGGGWPAVVSSTVAIVIFGEIIPQSVSVRYGLAVGAAFAPFVLGLMYFMYPVAYPIALLLDHILGEDHGTMYKKAGLKTLVTLHKTMGVERLNEDEVTIISAVLDLKEKPVGTIMTPMEDVFVLSADTILDEVTMEKILHTGFNRIPIHCPGEPDNFIGMLLVRILITYDPEDALPISSFPLATLPETGPDTSCLNILNYFQEGKSHMIIVSENPGEPRGALGVLTLEDVIEELIGEEIIDESDVYIDVHKAIRRSHPGPLSKRSQQFSPRASLAEPFRAAAVASNGDLTKLKLGPSNKASNPIPTSSKTITVKPAHQEPHNHHHHEHHLMDSPIPNGSSHSVDIDQQLLGPPNAQNGTISRTEAGAIAEAALRRSQDKDHRGDLAYENRVMTPTLPESHSYRTGGIIESVITVQGINKVVIEDASPEVLGYNGKVRPKYGSATSSRSNGSKEEEPLLSSISTEYLR